MNDEPKPKKKKPAKAIQAFLCICSNDPETAAILFATSNIAARRRYSSSQDCDFAETKVSRKKIFDQYAPGPVPPKALLEDGWYFDCDGCGRTLNYGDDDMWADGDDISAMKEIAEHNASIDAELAEFDRLQAEQEIAAADTSSEAPDKLAHRISYYDTPKYRRSMIAGKKCDLLIDSKALRFVGDQTFCHIGCQQAHYANIAKINVEHEAAEKLAASKFPEGHDFVSRRYPYLEARVEFSVEGLEYSVHWDPKEPDIVRVTNADKEAWEAILAQRTLQPA